MPDLHLLGAKAEASFINFFIFDVVTDADVRMGALRMNYVYFRPKIRLWLGREGHSHAFIGISLLGIVGYNFLHVRLSCGNFSPRHVKTSELHEQMKGKHRGKRILQSGMLWE